MTIEEFYTWHGYSSTDSLYGHCQLCFPRWEDKDPIALDPNFDLNPPIDRTEAINYELAGRQDASYSFKDFRSPTKARKRHRERNEKYYSWRDVKPGELGLPHRKPNTRTGFFYETLLADAPQSMGQITVRLVLPTLRTEAFRQWLEDDFKEVIGASMMYLVTGDDSQLYPGEKLYLYDYLWKAEGTMGGDWCGCGCCVCHRECHEQRRREREEEEADFIDMNEDEGWDLLSAPSTVEDSNYEWELLGAESASDVDDDWILTNINSPSTNPLHEPLHSSAARPFLTPNFFDAEGYLPYTHAHLLSDLATGRCRACVAQYLTRDRLSYYQHARLSDIAFLRNDSTQSRRVTVASAQLAAEDRTPDEQESENVVRADRAPLAEDYYRRMEPCWWYQYRCISQAACKYHDDLLWMLDVGCE